MAATFPLASSESTVKMDALVGEITQSVQALRDSWKQSKSEPADTSAPAIASPELQELRQRLVEASWQLYQHALGPREYLISLNVGVCIV